MPQKHPFAVTNFENYCRERGLDKKKLKARRERLKRMFDLYESCHVRDNFRRRVKLPLWRAVEHVTLGLLSYDDPNHGRNCLCLNCARAVRIPTTRPVKDVEAAKLRAYKQKREALATDS